MLAEQTDIWAMLQRIIACYSSDPLWRQDLLQESIVHLWQTETRVPGQTTSWYLQNCRFHVQHVLRSGRSLDAPRRAYLRQELASDEDNAWNEWLDSVRGDEVVVSEVCAREILNLVSQNLSNLEIQLLHGLINGSSTRELASQLQVSQTWIIKLRRRIACLAHQYGFQ